MRRQPSPRSGFVRELLDLLGELGWPGAPRFLGLDEAGREILSFLPGHTAWEPEQPSGVRSDESLRRAAELVREFHDFTAGTGLAESSEVVCHNDLSPANTVYQDLGAGLRPVAFIDWDLAAPGRRIHDIAHVCWLYLDIGPDSWAGSGGPGVAEIGRLIGVICEGYGLDDRSELVDFILWWQDRCWRGIDAGAEKGEPAMVRLRDHGDVKAIRAAYRWTLRHRSALEAALR